MKKCNSCGRLKIKTMCWIGSKCVEKEICINPFCKKYENVSLFNALHK